MKKKFKIEGMHCASCSNLVQKTLEKKQWVKSISVNIATNSAKIDFDEHKINWNHIKKEISSLGFQVVDEIKRDYTIYYKYRFFLSLLLSFPIGISMFVNISDYVDKNIYDLWTLLFWLIVVFILWFSFHKGCIKKIKKFQFNMDSLISLGSGTAYIYSVYAFLNGYMFHHFLEGASFIITFLLLGKYLETKSKKSAWDALWKLFELQQKQALVLEGSQEKLIDVEDIGVGTVIKIKAWEKIALDGLIVKWHSQIDESMLTGESMPVEKKQWDQVFGSTIALNGNLEVKVEKAVEESALHKIIEMVEEAQSQKAPIQKLADRVSGIFVPIVIIIACLTFLSWYFFIGVSFEKALLACVSVLVIACPCALGLATPTAIMVWSGTASKRWILIKTPDVLEKSGKIDVVVFDKTGTLTQGKPQVNQVVTFDNTPDNFQQLVWSLGKQSHHPLSQAIFEYAKDKMETTLDFDSFQEISGRGIVAMNQGKQLLLWNAKLLREYGVSLENDYKLQESSTSVFIAYDGELILVLGLIDTSKPWAKETIQRLKQKGIESYMITWDTQKTAQAIGKEIWIENIISEVFPEEKLLEVKKIQETWKIVAFVWDGINDSPALAQSDLWIWMWTGTDVAIETAGIVLVWWEIEKVVEAIDISKRTYRTIQQNLFWAFFYNIVMIPLAFLGLLLPMYASLAMSMSSVSVVLNSLRMKK